MNKILLILIGISYFLLGLYTCHIEQENFQLKKSIKEKTTYEKMMNRLYYDTGKNFGIAFGYGYALKCVKKNGYENCKDKYLEILERF